MKFNNVKIESFGYHLPEKFISSDEIEDILNPVYERLRLPKGRLELQTGIKTRGVWDRGTRPSILSTQASINCLRKSNIKNNEIDLLIHASVCRDFLEPATASVVHRNLEMSNDCMFFDLSNACLGVLSGILTASEMIERGSIKSALIVSGENGGPLLDETFNFLNTNQDLTRKTIKNYIANLTIGSAATAILLTHKDLAPDGHKIIGGVSRSKTDANELCQGDGNTHGLMMETRSEDLLKAGVELVTQTWSIFLDELNWSNDSFNKLVGHQVGVAHRNAILDSIKVSKDKDYSTFESLGNTGSSALPVTLMKAHEDNFIKKSDTVALLGIGSGLSTVMLGVEW